MFSRTVGRQQLPLALPESHVLFSKVDKACCFLLRDALDPLLLVETLVDDVLTGSTTLVLTAVAGFEGSSGSKNV